MPVIKIKFYPVTYDDNTQTIRYIKTADIRIIIKDGERQSTKSTSNKYLKELYQDYIINYSQAQNWLTPKSKIFAKTTFVPQGPWYKIEITEDGLYKILSSTLTSAGINISTIDPRTFQLFNNGGKPLNINALSTENNPTEPVGVTIFSITNIVKF